MNQEPLIALVSKRLKEAHDKHAADGFLASYIWGSVLTADFDPETSDVDTISIVDDRVDPSVEEKVLAFLASKLPQVKKIGFHIVYKSELASGSPKSPFAKFIAPPLLLLDLPTWHFVSGTRFEQKDLAPAIPSYEEAIALRFESTKKRWPDIDAIRPEEVPYFIKQILRIIHLRDLRRKNSAYTLFSYSGLLKATAYSEDTELVHVCFKIRESKWSMDAFRKNKDIFKDLYVRA